MSNWIKKQITNIVIAMGNTEKNAFGQEGIEISVDTAKHQRLNQNSVMDALLRGEITEEVEKLRWRMYKTTSSLKNYGSKVIGYDDDGYPIMETSYYGDEDRLLKIKTEPTDTYPLIMVVDNTNISSGVGASLNRDIQIYKESEESTTENIIDESILNIDDSVNAETNISLNIGDSKTIGETKDNTTQLNLPISITREHRPKFELENHTKKLHVKKITHKEFLLEFFISKYPEQFDKNHHFFLSDIKKIIATPTKYNSTVDIKQVSFITNNAVGVPDFLEFEYSVNKFDKIVEFNEFYVVKFIATVTVEAKSIIEKYKNEELEQKYNNKEKR
jgi:hypothetical protein